MKFGIFSDLHMEFEPWFFEPDPDVFYLNAGDTHPQFLMRDYFFSLFKNDNLFSVMGNHDFYGSSFHSADQHFHERQLGNLKIAGATLWTNLHPLCWDDYKRYMMDYSQIRGMTYDRYMNAHITHRDFLFASKADIWVIHHLPSWQSVHEDYRYSAGNEYFATELSDMILDMERPPKLIVHGHTHRKFDYMIGDTRVICNPRGYPNENEWYKNYQPVYVEIE